MTQRGGGKVGRLGMEIIISKRKNGYLQLVSSHFDKLLANGLAALGPSPSSMWMATLDTRTGQYPENDTRPPHIPRRHYRAIDAPRGCSLYWDQPAAVAAHELARLTGKESYGRAVDSYVAAFLERCVAKNGIFLWGNHYYWDAFQGKTLKFRSEETPQPVDFKLEEGDYHETRPIPPAWEIFWRVSPEKAEKEIRASITHSFCDAQSGAFNRHADGKLGCAFLESGGIIAESLAWLYEKTRDRSLLEQADRIINFSFGHRNAKTGLLENNPTDERWDKFICTTEIGLWGGSLLRAARRSGGQKKWGAIAGSAVLSYLEHAYDSSARKYFGRLLVVDGTPVLGGENIGIESNLLKKHQPGNYSDVWHPFFPVHDYPMPFAECCLSLYEFTKEHRYLSACEHWVEQIINSLPAREGKGGYAEHYGRCVHFLWRCGHVLDRKDYFEHARRVAREAVDVLFDCGMFRGHPGEHRYDAVDGVGYLLLALIALETDHDPDMMGTGW